MYGGLTQGQSYLVPKMQPILLLPGQPRLGCLFSPLGSALPILTWPWWVHGGLESSGVPVLSQGAAEEGTKPMRVPPSGSPLMNFLVPTAPGPTPQVPAPGDGRGSGKNRVVP